MYEAKPFIVAFLIALAGAWVANFGCMYFRIGGEARSLVVGVIGCAIFFVTFVKLNR